MLLFCVRVWVCVFVILNAHTHTCAKANAFMLSIITQVRMQVSDGFVVQFFASCVCMYVWEGRGGVHLWASLVARCVSVYQIIFRKCT